MIKELERMSKKEIMAEFNAQYRLGTGLERR
jgi:hypothetical protein